MNTDSNRLSLRLAGTSAVGVLMLLLADATPAHAQPRGNFDDADANHDGKVSLQEYQSYATSHLLAANGPMARRFQKLSPGDQAAKIRQRFQQLDTGHKGYLARSDWGKP